MHADTSTQLPTADGVTARYVDDAANGVNTVALTAPPAGQLRRVALFFDVASQDLGDAARTKYVTIIIGGGGWHHSWGGSWGARGVGGAGASRVHAGARHTGTSALS